MIILFIVSHFSIPVKGGFSNFYAKIVFLRVSLPDVFFKQKINENSILAFLSFCACAENCTLVRGSALNSRRVVGIIPNTKAPTKGAHLFGAVDRN